MNLTSTQTQNNNPFNYHQLASPKLKSLGSVIDMSSHSISSHNSNKIQQLFNLPQLKTEKLYQKTVKQIAQLLGEFDKFTDNLQAKVDSLLVAQQNQFVDSYKRHMKKVQCQYKQLQKQVESQKQQIKYYENEGKMSNLIKKVAMLQNQSKNLYAIIQKKQKQLKSINLELKVLKQEYKRLYAQHRELLKAKNESLAKLEQKQIKIKVDNQKSLNEGSSEFHSNNNEDLKFFTTQIQENKSLKRQLSLTADENKKKGGFTSNLSEQTISYHQQQQQKTKTMKLKAQVTQLSQKNKKLAKISSKILESQNELQNIFINSVAEIKRQITIKRKIRQCTFQDFKNEDKINLLLTIISNDQILKYVYERIFSKQEISIPKQHSSVLTHFQPSNHYRGLSTASNAHQKKSRLNKSQLPII